MAAGYSAQELDEILLEVPFTRFKDEAWEDQLPLVGHPLSVLLQRGIYEGRFFQEWMRGLLEAKGDQARSVSSRTPRRRISRTATG